jgi:hypothetical protein
MAISARVVRLQYEDMKDKYDTRLQTVAPHAARNRESQFRQREMGSGFGCTSGLQRIYLTDWMVSESPFRSPVTVTFSPAWFTIFAWLAIL